MSDSGTVLQKIAQKVSQRLEERNKNLSSSTLRDQTLSSRMPHSFIEALSRRPAIIAEIKFASPSQGRILETHLDAVEVAKQYLANGAAALSVLTEQDFFLGSLANLRRVREAFPEASLLMKDFVFDERQVFEARINGADAVLLMVSLLGAEKLKTLLQLAHALGLTGLVEVHDADEMSIAKDAGAKLIGVNSRNLKTLEVSLETPLRLAKLAPIGAVLIAESGITSADQIRNFCELGYHGVLIGTTLMRGGEPGKKLAELQERLNFKTI